MFKYILGAVILFSQSLGLAYSCQDVVDKYFLPAVNPHFEYDLRGKIHIAEQLPRRGLSDGTRIWVECVSDPQEFVNVLSHELGHVLHTQYFAPRQRRHRSKFSDFDRPIYYSDKSLNFYQLSFINNTSRHIAALNFDFVSSYAMTDPFEDFAESFMMYLRYRSEFKRLSQDSRVLRSKYDFLATNFPDMPELSGFKSEELAVQNLARPYDATLVHRKS